jgi:hypothetical protein
MAKHTEGYAKSEPTDINALGIMIKSKCCLSSRLYWYIGRDRATILASKAVERMSSSPGRLKVPGFPQR